jgi:DNA polymerase
MRLIRLDSEIDFDGWRRAARSLIVEGVPPEAVEWTVGDAPSLLAGADAEKGRHAGLDPASSEFERAVEIPAQTTQLTVPRAFVTLAQSAILHSDPGRFGLLYRLLWRLGPEPGLLNVASDIDVSRAREMSHGVGREIHKTHAFVRFREVAGDAGPVYVAWFEPTHHTLEAAAPFFMRRFASMRWSILTPRVSAHWDGESLRFTAGATQAQAPQGDVLEDLWRTYYASIFNPARLKTDTMRSHMPRKYWRNLPEAELIDGLVAGAAQATGAMIDHAPSVPKLRAPTHRKTPLPLQGGEAAKPPRGPWDADGLPAPVQSIETARADALHCTACPLYRHATQTVFGEGPANAEIMFVGEQPGDHEDLTARPFVGPAGQLFDRALKEAGIARDRVYVTNAVKHFKFEPRGRRRIHKTPAQQEIEACRGWLLREIDLVRPPLIVALGSTAANALLKRPTPVQRNRGTLMTLTADTQVMITVHPSYLLRVPADRQPEEYREFVADLALARASAANAADQRNTNSRYPPAATSAVTRR